MARTIELIGNDVIIRDGNTVQAIKADEANASYLQLKAETNNFTENMIQKSEAEILQETVDTLVISGLM